ncbi:hypothetical protein EVAR_78346_1 [Eumeta japonica]|uniref:Uncharacterized protein n=1 Tax=Eumeta variegata TaxID=151549 RepID=A0A4C1T5X8_EUMVA|nr:hypothetical protein EVAR_78346_1 [Eumeta japonica]
MGDSPRNAARPAPAPRRRLSHGPYEKNIAEKRLLKNKRICEPRENRWSPPLMDIRNPKGISNATYQTGRRHDVAQQPCPRGLATPFFSPR